MRRLVLPVLLGCLAAACSGEAPDSGAQPPPAQQAEVVRTPRPTAEAAEAPANDLVAGLDLPSTFSGTLPCADCPGIRYRLNLWPDGVFHLTREWLERGAAESELGRWRRDPARDAIVLQGERRTPLQFEVIGPRILRQLDVRGEPIESDLPYELTSDGSLQFLELSAKLRGLFTYMADAPGFEECLTGRFYPVAMEEDYIELERAYLAADKPRAAAPLLAVFDGRITRRPPMEGDGDIAAVVVERFAGLFPDQTCERAMNEPSLTNTYWRVVTLREQAVPAIDNRREPHMVLHGQDNRYAATVGCNRLIGSYDVEGERITFHSGATTTMACPPPLDERERLLGDVLAAARSWRIDGQHLLLFDAGGGRTATFEAVYLR
jgi:copper homeostasis protein (lipoprotein)